MNDQSKNLREKILDFLTKQITHRRSGKFDVLIWTFILWVIWLDQTDLIQFISNLSNFISLIRFKLKLGFPPHIDTELTGIGIVYLIRNFDPFTPWLIKFLGAIFFSGLSHLSLRIYVSKKISEVAVNVTEDDKEKKEKAEKEALIRLLYDRAGIKKIYEGKGNTPAINQNYVTDMMDEISSGNTRSIKILSIAGYETIGKGEGKSLFYDYLRGNNLDTECIVLNPNDEDTINERIKQLKIKYPEYTPSRLKKEINETINKLKSLKSAREDDSIKGYFCKFHPIFRLIIFDHCLFMSTYEMDRHGHESPVYKIYKVLDQNSNHLSLYDTFLNLFDKIKKYSDPITL